MRNIPVTNFYEQVIILKIVTFKVHCSLTRKSVTILVTNSEVTILYHNKTVFPPNSLNNMSNTDNTRTQRNKSCTTSNPVLLWKHGRLSLVFLTHPIGYGPQNSPKLKDIFESSLAKEDPYFQTHCIHLPQNLHTVDTKFSILNSFLSSNLFIIYKNQEWHFIRNTL
jgi:hypothetical protein